MPRLELPDYARTPPERHTVWAVLESTVLHDNHPPAYYLLMLPWTFFAGASTVAIRLPSVLLGTATIALVFVVARRRYGPAVALVAAALLAVHGHHVFWSQWARMWVLMAFLGVLSVALLQDLARRWRLRTAVTYAAVSALGLWTEYYYWPFFLAQVLWALFHDAHPRRPPRIVGAQVLALVLSVPVVLILRMQLWTQPNYLKAGMAASLVDLLALADLFPRRIFGLTGAAGPVAHHVLAAGGAVLLAAGIAYTRAAVTSAARDHEAAADVDGHRDRRVLLGLQVASATVVSGLIVLGAPLWEHSRNRIVIGCALAWMCVVVWWLGSATWRFWAGALMRRRAWRVLERLLLDLITVQVLAALAALSVVSLRASVAAERGLLIFAPLLLVLMAAGIFRLTSRPFVRSAICAALIVLGLTSVVRFYGRTWRDPDYRALASAVVPQIRTDDVVAIENAWWAEPIHYYLRPDRVPTVERTALIRRLQAGDRCDPSLPQRVWVFAFRRLSLRVVEEDVRQVIEALPHYETRARASADGASALLLQPRVDRCRQESREVRRN